MRKLMWFTVGFAAACFIGVYCSFGVWVAFLSIILMLPLLFFKRQYTRILAVILIGLAAGSFWLWGYDVLYLQAAKDYDGETVNTEVIVSDYSYETDYGVAADGEITLQGKTFRIRFYLAKDIPLTPGDGLKGKIRLRLTTEDALQGPTYHEGKGIFLLGYADEEILIDDTDTIPLKYYAAKLRKDITQLIDNAFPADTLGFARALLLGDSTCLDYETDTAFKLSGIRHVIAVSGLHVSILIALVYIFSGRRRILTALLGLPVLFAFAAVAGFTPSVVRACIMQGLMILALLFDKEYDSPTALAFAVLVMLCLNPMTITSVSFQLSVGCIVGILLFYHRIRNRLIMRMGKPTGKSLKAKMLRWIASSASITLSTMITTTPLSAYYFGTVSLVGLLTNLLTLWVISFIFYGIILACVVGVIWLPAAKLIAWLISWPVRFVLFTAKLLAGLPYSAVYTCSGYIVLWLAFCYVLFGVFLCCRRKKVGILMSCMLTGLLFALIAAGLEPQFDKYRVTALDVGQGQAILIQSDGGDYLVDCGGDTGSIAADTVSAQLLSQGIAKLDGLILTHFDTDHAEGVLPLLTRIKVDRLYLPDIADSNGIRKAIEGEWEDRICWITEDSVLSADTMTISFFPPPDGAKGNESCMCILFQTENCDILITGDLSIAGEDALLERIQLPRLELLVAGHHGSAYSTGLALLSATQPKAVVISVGEDNSYGHPAGELLYRLKLFGCSVWRTDLDGTITFRG